MEELDSDIEKYKRKNSSRHHYIPQFLIDGFTSAEGVVYVYDKNRSKILNKPKAPKAIFFERDRNNIDLPDNNQSSILEDILYREIDNLGSSIVKYFQDTELDKVEFNEDNVAQFLFFLISLFWRIPKTDFAVEDLIARADIESKGISPEILKRDDGFKKTKRPGLITHTIKEMINSSETSKKYINLHQMSNEILVLGDNPLLFKKMSTKFSEFGKEDFLIALTSRRIYSSTHETLGILKNINAFKYNAAVIDQSLRYVCCSNKDTLEKSVKVYEEFCRKGLNFNLAESTFRIEDTK